MREPFEFPEGATPLSDFTGLIPNWVHNLNDLNRVEAENILYAQRIFLRGRIDHPGIWFQTQELKDIHKAMFGGGQENIENRLLV